MESLPDISNELCRAIEYYFEHVKTMGTTGWEKEDAEKFARDWLEVQMRLALYIFHKDKEQVTN